MAIRFRGQWRPPINENILYNVDIHDTSGGGAYTIKVINVHIYTESETRDPQSTINSGRAEVTFAVEDAIHEAFISDLATAVTDRFYLHIDASSFTRFIGIITHEFVEWDDEPYPFAFTINAIDGVARMKDIDYVDDSGNPYEDDTNENFLPALDQVFYCFEKLNLDTIYPTLFHNREHIYMICNWYATNMANTSDNPLSMLYINTDLFYDIDNDGEKIPKKCFYVLETVLRGMGMRINYAGGAWVLEQLSERNPGANTWYVYGIDGTDYGTKSINWNSVISQEDTAKGKPKYKGTFGILPALRQVKVIYEYDLFGTAIEPDTEFGFGGEYTGGGNQKFCYEIPSGGVLRSVHFFQKITAGIDIRFRVHFQLMVKTAFTGAEEDFIPHRFLFRIYLAVSGAGSKNYAYRRLITSPQLDPVYGAAEWVAWGGIISQEINQGGWDYMSSVLHYDGSDSPGKYFDVGFETIPWVDQATESFLPYICVELIDVVSEFGAGALGAGYTHEWAISDLKVILAETQDHKAKATKKKQDFTSRVNAGGRGEKTINTRISDKGNVIKVWDGSELKTPGGWGVGAGGSKELGQLLADETHKLRGEPIKTRQGVFIGNSGDYSITARRVLEYLGMNLVAMETSHDYKMNEIGGHWWDLPSSISSPPGVISSIGEVATEYNRIDNKDVERIGGIRRRKRGVAGDGFSVGDTEFVVPFDLPDKLVLSEDDMAKILKVYRGGVKLTYLEGAPVGPREHSINNVNNSITFASSWGLEGHEEVEVFLG